MSRLCRAALHALLLVSAACATPRDRDPTLSCPTWKTDIAPIVEARCQGCHASVTAYPLADYDDVLAQGSDDVANAIAGDPASLFLARLDPIAADEAHTLATDELSFLTDWVTTCNLQYGNSALHGQGIMNPATSDFHGSLLRETRYDFELCASCHGDDFSGGASEVACTACHADGPKACSTCHGELVTSGAHAAHVTGGVLERSYDCSTCHVTPSSVEDIGHVLLASGELDPAPADLTFAGPGVGTMFDPATRTCQGAYCHGATLGDVNASNTTPNWDAVGQGQADCGTCHSLTPSTHVDTRCQTCHSRVINTNGQLVATTFHLDGSVTLGDTGSGCNDCHGSVDSPAPPMDLLDQSDPAFVTVGAHASHVTSANHWRGPIPCGDCHPEPTILLDPGHIDSAGPAELFPLGATGLAGADNAVPVWDRDAATCSSVYCHGGGDTLANDATPSINRTPVWTAVGQGQAACGSCHGIPPQDGMHAAIVLLSECANCHGLSITATGAFIFDNNIPPASRHIDGTIDFN